MQTESDFLMFLLLFFVTKALITLKFPVVQVEDFSYVLTVVKKCITVAKLCKERFVFYFLFARLLIFFTIKSSLCFFFSCFILEEKSMQKPFCLYFIWMLSKKVLPLHRFFLKLDITDPKQ